MTADIATPSQIADAEGAVDRESWLERMDEIFDEAGHFEALGHRHWSAFWDESPSVLVVSFERMETIRAATPGKMPFGYAVARSRGWSYLCIIAEGETWFRAPEVYRHFDRLVDDAFFEDFDQVLFYGADMGGYAAAAYSVAAPGATVLAIQPRATLDPALAIWDDRNTAARRLCFTDRYGFAPDMIEGAARVWTVHDPAEHLDAMHAAMFRGPHVTALRGRNLGAQMEQTLSRLGVLESMVATAAEGRLTPAVFARAIRERRRYGPYLRQMLRLAADSGHPRREAWVCRSVVRRMGAPMFRRRLLELEPDSDALARKDAEA